ncbi:helix-turn-helix domain-containing protein [Natronobacterium texcoconense]|uniref:Predicted DNA binding protein, contains HTH domain n=1 Tax=Natronobacterium texcoconense TaxID=1095778 RepID=A0A1H1GVX8_NATTX|nr:helix-turn-helix domain-containing protein [Natronobacterium texcoconense]SDR17311.1 Predicted DNA binding protein, contains HTH domain [Natronobacterium texcoconense]
MKRVTYVITPHGGCFDPTEHRFREHDVELRAIHEADILADGTVNVLLEVVSTRSQILTSFPDDPQRLVDCEISAGGETTMVQLRYEPTERNRKFLEPHRTYGVIVRYPMTVVDPDRSTLRVTVVGSETAVQNLVRETRALGDLTVETVTTGSPSVNQQFDDLTQRQQDVLVTAYEHGYYEDPREATYEDIAADLDCSASSVGQILRRIESTLVTETVSDRSSRS